MKSPVPRLFRFALCLVLLLCVPGLAAAAQEAGRVITLTPGVTVQRGGQTLPLKVKDSVEPGDTLITDSTGRVRVLFGDDSSIALGSNTVFTLEHYAAEGSKANFSGRMAKGLLRSITGKIVEQNPSGFALTTPEAAIGIRGTILSVRSVNGFSTVYVENTLRQVFVNGANVPQLNKITVTPGQPPRMAPITPQDRRDIGRELAFHGGNGSAAAAPEPSVSGATATDRLIASAKNLPDAPAMAGFAVDDLAMPLLVPTTARVQGTLTVAQMVSMSGSAFSFNVNLGSGAISNGAMSASGLNGSTALSFAVSGGTGSLSGGNFTIGGFTGSMFTNAGGPTTALINPGDPTTMSGTAAGGVVTGEYLVKTPTTPVIYFDGTLSGK